MLVTLLSVVTLLDGASLEVCLEDTGDTDDGTGATHERS